MTMPRVDPEAGRSRASDTTPDRSRAISQEDDWVFHLLSQAREQYAQYIEMTKRVAPLSRRQEHPVPPSPDLPLSLTLRLD